MYFMPFNRNPCKLQFANILEMLLFNFEITVMETQLLACRRNSVSLFRLVTHWCSNFKTQPNPSVVSRWRGEFASAERCNHQRWVAGGLHARPVLPGSVWFWTLLSVQWAETASRWCQYAKTKGTLELDVVSNSSSWGSAFHSLNKNISHQDLVVTRKDIIIMRSFLAILRSVFRNYEIFFHHFKIFFGNYEIRIS